MPDWEEDWRARYGEVAAVFAFAQMAAAIVLAGTHASENWIMVGLGPILILAALFTTGFRPGLMSRGPCLPISKAGRIILFTGGAVMILLGASRLISR